MATAAPLKDRSALRKEILKRIKRVGHTTLGVSAVAYIWPPSEWMLPKFSRGGAGSLMIDNFTDWCKIHLISVVVDEDQGLVYLCSEDVLA